MSRSTLSERDSLDSVISDVGSHWDVSIIELCKSLTSAAEATKSLVAYFTPVAGEQPGVARNVLLRWRRGAAIRRRCMHGFAWRTHAAQRRRGPRLTEVFIALLSKFNLFDGRDNGFAEVKVRILLQGNGTARVCARAWKRASTGAYFFDICSRFQITFAYVIIERLSLARPEQRRVWKT